MVDVANADVVAILTRAPSSGGKTRLFATLGMPADRELLEALLLDTVDGIGHHGPGLVLAVTPPDRCAEVASLVPSAQVLGQGSGDLGNRMSDVITRLFNARARRVVLIGSDLPEITRQPVAAAFAHLDEDARCVVLGPAADGGYYLVGCASPPPVFTGIDWDGAHVLRQTEVAAARAGVRTVTVPGLHDVDTAEDLQRVVVQVPLSRTAKWAVAKGVAGRKADAQIHR